MPAMAYQKFWRSAHAFGGQSHVPWFTEIGEKSHAYLESSSHRGFTGIDQRSRAASGRISAVRVRCDADGATVESGQRATGTELLTAAYDRRSSNSVNRLPQSINGAGS